jgi:tetratricopeptide (TPR) repeat protein
LRALGEKAQLGAIYHSIGLSYSKKGEWDKAMEFHHKSESILDELGDKIGLANIYDNIAGVYRAQENFQQALHFGLKSLEITLEAKDFVGEKLTRYGLAKTLASQQRYTEAVTHLERCVEIDQQFNHSDLEGDKQWLLTMQLRAYLASGTRYGMLEKYLASVNDLQKGDLFRRINDWPRAISHYQGYLRKNRNLLSVEQAQIQNLIGVGYVKQTKGDSALPYFQSALQTFQKLNNQEMLGTVYNNLGSAHKIRQAWPEALAWLRKSMAYNREVVGDSASVLGFTYYHIAEVFSYIQQSDSASYYVEQSLRIRNLLGDNQGINETLELKRKISQSHSTTKY